MARRLILSGILSPLLRRALPLAGLALLLSACGTLRQANQDHAPRNPIDVSAVPNAVPRVEPLSRYGNADYSVYGRTYHVMASSVGYDQRGIASWYGTKFHGRRTSSGEPYDMYAMTAAHKTLPLPTFVRVTNLDNGRWVIVKVNDRGPFHANRIIDLSYAAAAKLGMLARGTAPVEVQAIDPRHPTPVIEANRSTPPPAAHGAAPTLFLQVGAFVDRRNAELLRRRLERESLPGIEISQGFAHQQAYYRVRVGPLDSVDEADRMARTLERIGIRDPRVIVD